MCLTCTTYYSICIQLPQVQDMFYHTIDSKSNYVIVTASYGSTLHSVYTTVHSNHDAHSAFPRIELNTNRGVKLGTNSTANFYGPVHTNNASVCCARCIYCSCTVCIQDLICNKTSMLSSGQSASDILSRPTYSVYILVVQTEKKQKQV